jgi:hypothetical protein
MKKNLILLCFTAALYFLNNKKRQKSRRTTYYRNRKPLTKADSIVNEAIEARWKCMGCADYSLNLEAKY